MLESLKNLALLQIKCLFVSLGEVKKRQVQTISRKGRGDDIDEAFD